MAITDQDIKEYLDYSIFYVPEPEHYFLVKNHDTGDTHVLESTNMQDAEEEAFHIMKEYVSK